MEMAKECESGRRQHFIISRFSLGGDAIHARGGRAFCEIVCDGDTRPTSARLSGGHALKSLARTAGVELWIVVPRVRERRRAYLK